jgi:hypothetical protein
VLGTCFLLLLLRTDVYRRGLLERIVVVKGLVVATVAIAIAIAVVVEERIYR